MKIHTAIIDDNNFLIRSVKEKLSFFEDINISFTANNGLECIDKLNTDTRRTDLILMDIEMPVLNGIDATAMIKQKYPQIKIIMLTVFDNDDNIFKAIQSGAAGYLLKDTAPQTLYDTIAQTIAGGAMMTPSIALRVLSHLSSPLSLPNDAAIPFTNKEIEVLEHISTGLPYTAIAAKLYITPSAVRKYVESVYHKIQACSKTATITLQSKRG